MSGYLGGNRMTEEMKVEKQETMKKSPAFLLTVDGQYEVEPEVVQICGTLYNEMQAGRGCSENNPISVPPTIRRKILIPALVFGRHLHYHKGSNSYVKNFLRMDVHVLCEFIQVADYLQMKSLIDCTCEAMFKRIPSKQSAEEFLSSANWPDDISEKDLAERIELVTRLVREKKLNDKEHENLKNTAILPMSPAFVQTVDDHIFEVEPEVAQICESIYKEMQAGRGCSKNNPISVPPTIRRNFLIQALVFCRDLHYHKGSNSYVKNFLKMDAHVLCEFIQIADYLQMKSLIDCTSEALFKKIKTLQSAKEFFNSANWPHDISKKDLEERIELVTRLVREKKLKDKEQENLKKTAIVPKLRNVEDTRSVNDLLKFIDGGDRDSKGGPCSKKKKKNKKRDGKKNGPSPCASSSDKASDMNKVLEGHNKINTQDTYTSETTSDGINSTSSISTAFANKLDLLDTHDKSFSFEDDVDDGNFDPSISEELDREVEDFARRLKTKPPVIYFDSSRQEVDLVQVCPKGKGFQMKGLNNLHWSSI